MKIDRNNYEQWALDYIEGSLADRERSRFEEFLSRHGDIAGEVTSLREYMPCLPIERVVYPDKQALLRGRKFVTLHRAGSFLGGVVAASVLMGLFLLVDRTHSGDPQTLVSQNLPAVEENLDPSAAASGEADACPAGEVAPVKASAPVVLAKGISPAVPSPVVVCPDRIPQDKLAPVLTGSVGFATTEARLAHNPLARVTAVTVPKPVVQDALCGAEPFRNHGLLQAEGPEMRSSLATILAPIDWIIPIKTYRTENESGVVIASLIRIGNRNVKNK